VNTGESSTINRFVGEWRREIPHRLLIADPMICWSYDKFIIVWAWSFRQ